MIKRHVQQLVQRAKEVQASDIHFVISNDEILVQFRIGSLMFLHETLTLSTYQMLLSYIRYEASLSLSKPKQPQSGVLTLQLENEPLSCRVSILPTYHYQSLVLRLLYQDKTRDLDELAYFKHSATQLKQLLQHPVGLILISGPTGSGKTTTTYAMMQHLKQQLHKSVISLEDPVECYIKSFLQISIQEQGGMSFEAGLREVLRHDPDVIVIGEIRDEKTARYALRAALTGHLVISTVHAKSCASTIHRLVDLGLPLHDLMQVCVGIVNQKLLYEHDDKKALYDVLSHDELTIAFDELLSLKHFSSQQMTQRYEVAES